MPLFGYGRNASTIPTCFVCIPADQIGVWECCHSYKGVITPGCHFLGFNLCGFCISVRAVSTRVEENICKCETKTKDNVFVQVTCAVQQQPNTANKDTIQSAIYKLTNPHTQVSSYVADVVRAEVPKMTLDEVFENKDAIAYAVATKLTDNMAKFGYNILQALVTNVEPDARVKQALNNVEAAAKNREASETMAKANHYVSVKKAEAEAESKALQGQGIAKQRAAIVDGLRESIGFEDDAKSAKQVTELLLVTQYFDTLEKVAEGQGTTVFIPSGSSGETRNELLQAIHAGKNV